MAEAKKLRVAWIADYPLEWLDEVPASVRHLPRRHPLTWERVLLEEFEKRGDLDLHVCVVRTGISSDDHFDRKGVQYHVIKTWPRVRGPSIYWTDTLVLKSALARIRPDVVHAWGSEQGAGIMAQRLGYPYLITVQGLMAWYAERMRFNFHERLANALERRTLPRAPLVTTEAAFGIEFLKRRYPGIRLFQIEHASNWLFHRIKRAPQLQPIRFLNVGHLGERKGTDLLFKALAQLSDLIPFELVLGGSIDPRFGQQFEDVKRTDLWKRVIWLPHMSTRQTAEELARATMLLFPTRADTSPNVVKEAAVAGVPIVATAIGGIPDYVFPGKNGVLISDLSMDALSNSIKTAIAHPLFGKGQTDVEVLARNRQYLSPGVMAERFYEAYRLVLKSKAKSENRNGRH
jgi:glycosyltransferase involved in cell wall biosynthesis